MQATDILSRYRNRVWKSLKPYLNTPKFPPQFSIPSKYQTDLNFHQQIIKEYPLRQGKYLRPTLLILTAQTMGIPITKTLLPAAAMQLSEEWLLAHDDIEDGSLERRGKPTLHRIYGVEQAINAGDSLQTIMWKILADNSNPKILEEFYIMLSRTTIGQTVEIKWTQENRALFTDDDWYFVADGKTSYYTIAGPMRLGATIAKATPKQLDALTNFGIYLGRCFQLVDDILDLTSDFAGLKKQVGNDVYEGKQTAILGHLLRTSSQTDKKRLIQIFSKTRAQKTPAEISWVLNRMHHYQSIDYAKKIASSLKEKAYSIFKSDLKFLSKQPYRQYLETLITFVLERDH